MITAENQKDLIDWAQERSGFRYRPDAKAIGSQVGDKLTSVVVYDNFSECDCNMHVVGEGAGWLTRELLFHGFHYPFVQCGLRRVTALVPAKNEKALKLDLNLGFHYEGCSLQALPDDDIFILGMLRDNCKFIPKEMTDD